VVDTQRQYLKDIVSIRWSISVQLRRFLNADSADKNEVLSLSKRYGESDGEISYLYATAFSNIFKTLSSQQKKKLAEMRQSNPADPKGPFLYSSPINMPKIENIDFLFGVQG